MEPKPIRNYVGEGTEKVFQNGGTSIRCRIRVSDLPEADQTGRITLFVASRKTPGQGGETHSVYYLTDNPAKG